ncbi:hypothetical protein L1N85_23680 [Paenibacillus alkaliterrae]|uniref:hypothetical protein n=1 Tax=Paenibacillus alkaliterrae TaxID=320909 RepID=UPI001F3B89FC|nr:hypothetical protein [Paenibacillus alkaliterrae]MCF2941353.1 hypothetical protein [Paenibacillus alkaliterrae]
MKSIILIGCLIGNLCVFTSDEITTASLTPSPAIVEASTQELQLLTVNRISLYDDPGTVVRKLGEPELITEDAPISGFEIYQYPDMNVVFRDGIVDFVEILEGAEVLLIDDELIPATTRHITEALGEPDYETEDGIVFERNEALLKLFIEPGNGQLTSISYFHSSSM